MTDTELKPYSNLYDLVADNKLKSATQLSFTKEEFLSGVGVPPTELKGIKGNLIYIVLKICKNRTVQKMLQKMPKWILAIGRKFVG